MSRIGKQPITIPPNITIAKDQNAVVIKGPKGEVIAPTFPQIKIEVKDNRVFLTRTREDERSRALHGLARALIANGIKGVSEGYEKRLEIVGTGYRAKKEGKNLVISLGFSHPVMVEPKPGVEFEVEGERDIIVKGADKQLVGLVTANLRDLKKPEPYKGKGIRYKNEVVRRKPGKAAKVGVPQQGAA